MTIPPKNATFDPGTNMNKFFDIPIAEKYLNSEDEYSTKGHKFIGLPQNYTNFRTKTKDVGSLGFFTKFFGNNTLRDQLT